MNPFTSDTITIFDGAMGTELQKRGMEPGTIPETLNITQPQLLVQIARDYRNSGSQMILANTFGAHVRKLKDTGYTQEQIVSAAIRNARTGAPDCLIGLDIGPLGELLEPLGTLSFEQAYQEFAQIVQAGVKAGADFIALETFGDLYEMKAALLAAKEHSSLPVIASMTFEEDGRTFTGSPLSCCMALIQALGADAAGLNCSAGPAQLKALAEEASRILTIPLYVKPNAGLPDPLTGQFSLTACEFDASMEQIVQAGAAMIGGCCGTSPEFIEKISRFKGLPVQRKEIRRTPFVCSGQLGVSIEGVVPIGERINPTGKKRFQQALLEHDLGYIVSLALEQEKAGAKILDVNVGYPGVDEPAMMAEAIQQIQAVCDLPLQIDSSDPKAIEAGLRIYNGIPIVNSVSGKTAVLEEILPLVKQYGACVAGLTLDEQGIPDTCQKRVAIAARILQAAEKYGIDASRLFIDPLTLTVSAQQDQAMQTLNALEAIRTELGLCTLLGISNISFGLPNRPLLTSTFLIAAMARGLNMPIVNVCQPPVMDAIRAFEVLSGQDQAAGEYIQAFAGQTQPIPKAAGSTISLEQAIISGLDGQASILAREALKTTPSLQLVETVLIPALDQVGAAYEKKEMYLPQLLGAARAAQAVFEQIRIQMANTGQKAEKKGTIVMATVHGDIHDIGKNIVKTVLENYGFNVVDLGKDVPAQAIVNAVRQHKAPLVGLSALMTTTLGAMEETIQMLRTLDFPVRIMVGGAVLTEESARQMGADFYAKDAQASAAYARELFSQLSEDRT